jgi:hypothetical protein
MNKKERAGIHGAIDAILRTSDEHQRDMWKELMELSERYAPRSCSLHHAFWTVMEKGEEKEKHRAVIIWTVYHETVAQNALAMRVAQAIADATGEEYVFKE